MSTSRKLSTQHTKTNQHMSNHLKHEKQIIYNSCKVEITNIQANQFKSVQKKNSEITTIVAMTIVLPLVATH